MRALSFKIQNSKYQIPNTKFHTCRVVEQILAFEIWVLGLGS
jgi:hypothetical protein